MTSLKQTYNSGTLTDFTYQSSSVIRCMSGYKWPSSQTESILCRATGQLNFSVGCSGINKIDCMIFNRLRKSFCSRYMISALFHIVGYYNCKIAQSCGDPLGNLTAQSQQYQSSPPAINEYPVSVTVKCFTGFMFADSTISKTMSCESNGGWTILPNCIGMNNPYF